MIKKDNSKREMMNSEEDNRNRAMMNSEEEDNRNRKMINYCEEEQQNPRDGEKAIIVKLYTCVWTHTC